MQRTTDTARGAVMDDPVESAAPQMAARRRRSAERPADTSAYTGDEASGDFGFADAVNAGIAPPDERGAHGRGRRPADPSAPASSDSSSGRHQQLRLGSVVIDAWVTADGQGSDPRHPSWQPISEADLAAARTAWQQIQNNTGNLHINETDAASVSRPSPGRYAPPEMSRNYEAPNGTRHGGFRAETLRALARLMSRPVGRRLVVDLVTGRYLVVIRPPNGPQESNGVTTAADAVAGATPGQGSGSTVTMDVDRIRQRQPRVYGDANFNQMIEHPMFVILSHELVHAQHLAAGLDQQSVPATDPAYRNREEQVTIEGSTAAATRPQGTAATGEAAAQGAARGGAPGAQVEPSENAIRAEHGLPLRVGLAGTELSPSTNRYLPTLPGM